VTADVHITSLHGGMEPTCTAVPTAEHTFAICAMRGNIVPLTKTEMVRDSGDPQCACRRALHGPPRGVPRCAHAGPAASARTEQGLGGRVSRHTEQPARAPTRRQRASPPVAHLARSAAPAGGGGGGAAFFFRGPREVQPIGRPAHVYWAAVLHARAS